MRRLCWGAGPGLRACSCHLRQEDFQMNACVLLPFWTSGGSQADVGDILNKISTAQTLEPPMKTSLLLNSTFDLTQANATSIWLGLVERRRYRS